MDPAFVASALVGTVAALLMVTRRNPVYSAVWLLVTFVSVAVGFLQLSASFLAAIHVLVYTGAILVLFVFVIMLLNLQEDELGEEAPVTVRVAAAVASLALFGLLASAIVGDPKMANPLPPAPSGFGSVERVGMLLFNEFGLPFELVSVLIIVAMFGALLLAQKRPSDAGPT